MLLSKPKTLKSFLLRSILHPMSLSKPKTLTSHDSPNPWIPPREGRIKINCAAATPTRGSRTGRFSAVARDFSGDLVGVSYGKINCDTPFILQMKSLSAGALLASELQERGIHPGLLQLETHHAAVAELVKGMISAKGFRNTDIVVGDEDCCRSNESLHEDDSTFVGVTGKDGELCITLIGAELPGSLPRGFLEGIEQDKKLLAGLSASRKKAADIGGSRGAAAN